MLIGDAESVMAASGIDFVVLTIEPVELAVVVLLERFDCGRPQPAADELVDRRPSADCGRS